MRIGAIDVGTNSVHLLIAEVHTDGTYTVVEKARTQVELGTGGLDQNRLADDAMARGLEALADYRTACDSLGVDDITCAATSAVREAENGSEFCRTVHEQTGIHVRVIAGRDEGRLIYLGARKHLDFSGGRVLLIDLGGGSTEFVLCDTEAALVTVSLPIGHIRASEKLVHGSPLSTDDADRIAAWTKKRMSKLLVRVQGEDFRSLVGTSGTMRCLARMATRARGAPTPEHGDGMVLHLHELDALIDTFGRVPAEHLADLPGMDARRRRTLPAGAVIVRSVMQLLEKTELRTSDYALRDGLVLDWVSKHLPEIGVAATEADPRRRSVMSVMNRYGVHRRHAQHVAQLALQLFDDTAELHGLRINDRRILEFASLLHDVGHHISGEGHARHGQYLIRHTRMSGFTAPEIEVLGNIVRYHRGKRPRKTHPSFAALPEADRQKVTVLAALLAVSDALDRGHNQRTWDLSVQIDDDLVIITARTTDAGHLERWSTKSRARHLGAVLKREVIVKVLQAEPS